MATVLEEYATEEQRYGLRFFVGKMTQFKGYSQRNVFCLQWKMSVA
jgi:hypothetical protein